MLPSTSAPAADLTVDLSLFPLSAADLAARWKYDVYTVRRWAKSGRITGALKNGRWRFAEDAGLRVDAGAQPLPHVSVPRRLAARQATKLQELAALEALDFTIRRR